MFIVKGISAGVVSTSRFYASYVTFNNYNLTVFYIKSSVASLNTNWLVTSGLY